MGNMGQRKGHRHQKRQGYKRRPSRKGRGVLAWLPDSVRPSSPAGKAALRSWLGHSFMMSNQAASTEWSLPDSKVVDLKDLLGDTAAAIADTNTVSEITLERPENGYPLWGAKMEMVVNGELQAVEIEGTSLDDVMNSAIGWINRRGIE